MRMMIILISSLKKPKPLDMIKKHIFLLLVLSFGTFSVFSQVNISTEQLVGDWKMIKCQAEGEDPEEDIIGSIFHFKSSGILLAEKPNSKKDEGDFQKKGTWKVVNNNIVLHRDNEDPEKDIGTTLNVTRFEGNLLFIYDPKEKVTAVFERIKVN